MTGSDLDTTLHGERHASGAGTLPNFLVIGAMKCGTTSLHYYLDQHPDITMSRVKEINFFLEGQGHWGKGVQWYESHFDGSAKIRGESSTSYTKYPQRSGVPARMRSVLPEAKLIYILRDPIERTVSHYLHAYHRSREKRSLADALGSLSDNPYVDPSRYDMQLERYLEHYPLSQILILTTEDLRQTPQVTLGRAIEFLGLTPHRFEALTKANVSERRGRNNPLSRLLETYRAKRIARSFPQPAVELVKFVNARLSQKIERPVLDADTRHELTEFLRDDVTRLRSLTGMAFEKWSL
ncbi:MAG: sulfotransferase domain-containing protein [Candidatus Dormibacteraeota bacterium]|nr:sulfotransferase domain-containing protein [Candidatus Dormibacteraeota bacterium]